VSTRSLSTPWAATPSRLPGKMLRVPDVNLGSARHFVLENAMHLKRSIQIISALELSFFGTAALACPPGQSQGAFGWCYPNAPSPPPPPPLPLPKCGGAVCGALEKGKKAVAKAGTDTRKTIGQAGTDTRTTIGKAGTDARKAIAKAGTDTRVGAQAAEKGINHFGDEFSKWFCSLMTNGGSDDGSASCSVSAGYNSSGRAYDPSDPTKVQPIPDERLKLPSKADLDSVYRFQTPPQLMEAWERSEDRLLKDYLRPGDRIGLPWASPGVPPVLPTVEGVIRASGYFLDVRRDPRYPGGYRFHGGTDYLTKVGDPIRAIAPGAITRTFIPSNEGAHAGLMAVEIHMNNGYTAQYLYIKPSAAIVAQIAAVSDPCISWNGDRNVSRYPYPVDGQEGRY
jgi:murein DD-endopeptidase MepM/ murein hydrolase activator NlpD